MRMLPVCAAGELELEILKNLRYSPEDKIALELGKILESEGKLTDALVVLRQISSRLNADWRSAYRSFFLISKIFQAMDRHVEADRYLKLCLTCNPRYPVSGPPKS